MVRTDGVDGTDQPRHTAGLPLGYSGCVLTGATLAGRADLVLPLRCLLGVRSSQADWAAFLELEAHLDKRRASAVWAQRQEQVVEVLRSSGVVAEDGSEDELVQRIMGILDVNSFEVRGPVAIGQQLGT